LGNKDYAKYDAIVAEANKAGIAAALAKVPAPMIVSQHANMLDDSSAVVKQWYVSDGVCGFASVKVRPGNSPFANYLKAKGIAKKDSYAGGVYIWVGDHMDGLDLSALPGDNFFNQSMEKKGAYASAFAAVLVKYGIKASYDTRMD
jgi:hypothetical protein